MKISKTFIRIVLVGVLSYSTYCVFFTTMFSFLAQSPYSPLDFWEFLFPFLTASISMVCIMVNLVKKIIRSLKKEE